MERQTLDEGDGLGAGDDTTLALKLKLSPTKGQREALNRAFWQWASVCNRISLRGKKREDLRPEGDGDFTLTQLNSAQKDVSDLRRALSENSKRLERELLQLQRRKSDYRGAIEDPAKRIADSSNPKLFVLKVWRDAGLLRTKYHTLKYYQSKIRETDRLLERKNATFEKMKAGKIRFRPTRITLHQDSVRVSLGTAVVRLTMLEGDPLEISIVSGPLQPLRGSSQRSQAYLTQARMNFLAYSINQILFGLDLVARALSRAKHPDKKERFAAMMRKKEENFQKKIRAIAKLLGRKLAAEELNVIEEVKSHFFANQEVRTTSAYRTLLGNLAKEIDRRSEFLNFQKYPLLLRSPLNSVKHKSQKNLKPDEWEYYIQFGYRPLLDTAAPIRPESIMGIDRGLRHAIAISVLDLKRGAFSVNQLVQLPFNLDTFIF